MEIHDGMGVRRNLAGRMASRAFVCIWVENMSTEPIISINQRKESTCTHGCLPPINRSNGGNRAFIDFRAFVTPCVTAVQWRDLRAKRWLLITWPYQPCNKGTPPPTPPIGVLMLVLSTAILCRAICRSFTVYRETFRLPNRLSLHQTTLLLYAGPGTANAKMSAVAGLEQRYDYVLALFIRWATPSDPQSEDDLNELEQLNSMQEQAVQLRKLFERIYKFEVEEFSIPRKSPYAVLQTKLLEVQEKYNGPRRLLIIYYSGHGTVDSSRNAIWWYV